MKTFLLLLSLATLSAAYAGENRFELKQKGLYKGTLENGTACELDVISIEKKLVTRKLKAIDAKVTLNGFNTELRLECDYDMENGKTCSGKARNFSILLNPAEGYHADQYPHFIYTLDGVTSICKNLKRN